MYSNHAFVIDTVSRDDIKQELSRVPSYGAKAASAIKRTIRMIHGVPDLHKSRAAFLEDIEIYLGRASTHTVFDRWQASRNNRNHKYATVLFTCDTERAIELEGLANKILSSLEENDTLCVKNANANPHGGGGVTAESTSVVYMTWSVFPNLEGYTQKPSIDIIRKISADTANTYEGIFTYQQIQNSLKVTKRLTEKERLEWFL